MTDKDLEPLDNISENLTEEQKKKLEKIIEEEEGVTRKVTGFWNIVITVLAVAMSLFALYTSNSACLKYNVIVAVEFEGLVAGSISKWRCK